MSKISFKYSINDVQIDEKLIRRRNGYEESFCLLEFGVSLLKWIDSGSTSEDYQYYSMDHDDEAIIEIKSENNSCRLYSPWALSNYEVTIDRELLKIELNDFLTRLSNDLFSKFKISIREFAR